MSSVFEDDTPLEERVLDVINNNEDYKEILQEIVAFEEQNPGLNDRYDDFRGYSDTAWSVKQLPSALNPGKLGHLKQQGIVTSVMKTNNSNIQNLWALTDREEVKQALKINKEGDVATVEHTETSAKDVPDDIFEPIVGHEDIKELMMASIEAVKPIHICLHGPPACGKTVFLEELQRLPESEFLVGSSTTGPGFIDQLFDNRPKNILIDEMDKMDKSDFGNMLSLQEDGLVKEVKGNGKRREMKLENATVYGAVNRIGKIPSENLSRFLGDPVITLPAYDDDEFHQVTVNVLVMREGTSEEMAKEIADIIVDETDIRDFRECRRIARLADGTGSVRKYVDIVQKYSDSSLL